MSADRLEALRERTRYVPHDVEPRVFERWESAGIFHPNPDGTAEDNYSIAIPPPNVTGALHMGHALNGSIQDVLIRRQRMRGTLAARVATQAAERLPRTPPIDPRSRAH